MTNPAQKVAGRVKDRFQGFLDFIRKQGVVGFAVGFILGGSISKFVTAIVQGVVNPLLAAAFGGHEELRDNYFQVGQSKIMWGEVLSTGLDFLIIAFVIYYGVKVIGLEKLDKPKN